MMKYLLLVDAGVGLVMIILAVPLILQKVRPNVWYGFRTPKTLSDQGIWYAANQYAGKALLLAGSMMVVGALVLHWVVGGAEYGAILNDPLMVVLWLMLLSVPLAACVIASFVYLKRL